MAHRAYVRVLVDVDETGKVCPRRIYWEDGRSFAVDRLLDTRRAASTRVGGQGIRYTCRIRGREVYLFEDEGRWFVEARDVPAGNF